MIDHLRSLADLYRRYSTPSYAQEGEDLVLRRIFGGTNAGFYVDVGAHHPKRFSNTYFFYKRGWNGINVDAAPGCMSAFDKMRPRDINIEAAVGNQRRPLTFFIFNEPALSTFDEALARERSGATFTIVGTKEITTIPLRDILARHVPVGKRIDFLNVDVEGFDLEVLDSNDWQLYRPTYIVVECGAGSCLSVNDGPISRLLVEQGYDFFGKTVLTAFFRKRE